MHAVGYTLAGFAIVFLVLACSRWLHGRRWAMAGNLALGLLGLVLAVALHRLGDHLDGYQLRTPGRPAAELHFEQVGSQRFRATLTHLPGGRMQVFELEGSEWRLVARVLDWTPVTGALGLAPRGRLYALESGGGTGDAAAGTRFALAEERGLDLWSWSRPGQLASRVAVGGEAASPWRPMGSGARFAVRWGRAELEVDPLGADAGEPGAAAR